VILISDQDVCTHVTFADVLEAIERAFVAFDSGDSELFEVMRGRGGGANHFFAAKAGRDGSIPVLGLKVGSYAPANRDVGMAAHTSTTLLIDDLTGRPFALVQANYLNGLRTAAADALAVRALARADASTLGIIGTGTQAICEALAVAHVRPIQRILAVGRDAQRREAFAAAMRARLDIEPVFVDAEAAARAADVLVTVTPAREPLVQAHWIRPGTHISAMGADDVGKQELDISLVARSEIWVDDAHQAASIGELQHAVRAGLVTRDFLGTRTLGRLLRTTPPPPRDPQAITLFDSSGLAIQDLAAAYACIRIIRGGCAGP
jgi:alanine dehydrogenase